MRHKKKQGKRDQYWELFGAFVLAASAGYRDTLARAWVFNETQTVLRKAPPSATGENACWVRLALRRDGSKDTDFSWRGKDVAIELANMPELGCLRYKETINSDLRPSDGYGLDVSADVSRVVDASGATLLDISRNHYIEGDNLRALKLLMPTYRGKIKMIYIDPPYNTGHDFVYRDKFDEEAEIFNRFLLGPIPHERGDEK